MEKRGRDTDRLRGLVMEKEYDDEIEIDLVELLYAIRRKLIWICLAGMICGAVAFGYTRLVLKPMYQSTTTMLVLTKETTLASLADLQMGTQLTKDYEILTTSHQVVDKVIENLKLDITYDELVEDLNINNPGDSRVMEITITYPNAAEAKRIVDEVASVTSEFIGDKMEGIPPKIIDEGQVAEYPSSPSMKKNIALGILLGVMVSCGIVVILTLMDDTIKSEEDVEHYLGIPTLAVVPDRKDFLNNKRKSDKQKPKKKKVKKVKK